MNYTQIGSLVKSRAASALSIAFVCMAVALPSGADPLSDTFQPDVFRTGPGLRDRTRGLTDPLSLVCPLPPSAVTLAIAVDIALCRNPATRTAWANAHLAAAQLGSADSAWLPSITGSDAESRERGSHVDVLGNIVESAQNTNDAALNLSWTLYDFGARTGKIRSARYLLDAAAFTTNNAIQQTVFNVVQDFYGVVAGDANLAAAKITQDTAAQSLDIVRNLHEGGIATLADVLQAETAYDATVLASAQVGQLTEGARGTFAVVIGVPADQPLKIDAEPVPSEVPALTARLSDLMTEAARQRPDFAAARAEVDSAVANISVARAAGWPQITVGAGRDRISTSAGPLFAGGPKVGVPLENYGQIGVTVTVPIFTGFGVTYGVRQAQAQLQVQQANADQVRLQVTLDVWNGYYALDAANKELAASAILLKTAQTDFEVAIGQYKAGVGIFLNLLAAQSSLAQARQSRIAAELAWEVARAQLALALGRLSGGQPLNALATPQ
jgi:outer membrane protein